MVNNNIDVRKAASELYHRLVETKEITNNDAKAAVGVLSVIQKSFMIDIDEVQYDNTFVKLSFTYLAMIVKYNY
jgi:hypothetical protein